jgi:hypothetical protein
MQVTPFYTFQFTDMENCGWHNKLLKINHSLTSCWIRRYLVRFEVFTAMTMKNTVFWDVAPCRYFVNRRFGGTYRLHLQGRSNPRAMNQCEQTEGHYVRFEVFTAMTMKNTIFWDVVPYRYFVNRCFGGTYRLHLQGRSSCPRWFIARGLLLP